MAIKPNEHREPFALNESTRIPMPALPSELFYIIYLFLGFTDLLKLTFVRNFRPTAIIALYRNLGPVRLLDGRLLLKLLEGIKKAEGKTRSLVVHFHHFSNPDLQSTLQTGFKSLLSAFPAGQLTSLGFSPFERLSSDSYDRLAVFIDKQTQLKSLVLPKLERPPNVAFNPTVHSPFSALVMATTPWRAVIRIYIRCGAVLAIAKSFIRRPDHHADSLTLYGHDTSFQYRISFFCDGLGLALPLSFPTLKLRNMHLQRLYDLVNVHTIRNLTLVDCVDHVHSGRFLQTLCFYQLRLKTLHIRPAVRHKSRHINQLGLQTIRSLTNYFQGLKILCLHHLDTFAEGFASFVQTHSSSLQIVSFRFGATDATLKELQDLVAVTPNLTALGFNSSIFWNILMSECIEESFENSAIQFAMTFKSLKNIRTLAFYSPTILLHRHNQNFEATLFPLLTTSIAVMARTFIHMGISIQIIHVILRDVTRSRQKTNVVDQVISFRVKWEIEFGTTSKHVSVLRINSMSEEEKDVLGHLGGETDQRLEDLEMEEMGNLHYSRSELNRIKREELQMDQDYILEDIWNAVNE